MFEFEQGKKKRLLFFFFSTNRYFVIDKKKYNWHLNILEKSLLFNLFPSVSASLPFYLDEYSLANEQTVFISNESDKRTFYLWAEV